MQIDYKLIGNRIKFFRKTCALTQEKLAEEIDVSVGYISKVERGIEKPNLELLASIASVVECDLSDLISDTTVTKKGYLSEELAQLVDMLAPNERRMLYRMIEYYIHMEKKR